MTGDAVVVMRFVRVLGQIRVRRSGQPRPPRRYWLPQPPTPRFPRPCFRVPSSQLDATALVVGIIIGASIFVQPSVITGAVPTVSGVFGVWLASGILTLFGALIAAELASAYPQAGGVYVFLKESFSPAVGFLWGWAMFWTMHTGIIAVIATVFARYATFFFPTGDFGARAIAVAAVVVLTAVNYLGVKQGSVVQTTFTILKVAAIVLIIAVAFALGPRVPVVPGPAVAAGRGRGRSHSRAFPRRSSPAFSRSAAGTW